MSNNLFIYLVQISDEANYYQTRPRWQFSNYNERQQHAASKNET